MSNYAKRTVGVDSIDGIPITRPGNHVRKFMEIVDDNCLSCPDPDECCYSGQPQRFSEHPDFAPEVLANYQQQFNLNVEEWDPWLASL